MSSSILAPFKQLFSSPGQAVRDNAALFSTTLLIGFCSLIYGDYAYWKSFGTGGTPPTLKGYYRMRRMGLYILFHPENLLDASPIPNEGPSYLAMAIPKREGGRPKLTRWTLPQRQFTEPIDSKAHERLHSLITRITSDYTDIIRTAPSKTEGGTGDAIYVKPEVETQNPNVKKIWYEIAHVHPTENSLHVYLSPKDARKVVEAGWGQRFPVSWIAPPSWVMVYAPRTEEEVQLVERIVRATVSFNTGVKVYDEGLR